MLVLCSCTKNPVYEGQKITDKIVTHCLQHPQGWGLVAFDTLVRDDWDTMHIFSFLDPDSYYSDSNQDIAKAIGDYSYFSMLDVNLAYGYVLVFAKK